jgi:hypothetical protein
MSVGNVTPEIEARWKMIQRILMIWTALGVVLYFAILLIYEPWGPGLGVQNSPQRHLVSAVVAAGYPFAVVIWGVYHYTTQQKWLAEDMGIPYEEGKLYPAWTPKRLVTIALGIAFFGITGAVPAATFDLPQFSATFLTVLYGPIEGAIGVGLGFLLIRGPIFSGMFNPFQLFSVFATDGMIYAILGNVTRRYIYYHPLRWRMTYGLAIYTLCNIAIHRGPAWNFRRVITTPYEQLMASFAYQITYWIPFAYLPNLILAYLVATALIKYKI